MKPSSSKTCVLLVNLGTPDEPTTTAVRRYLAEFLADPRVVEIPKPIWWLILHGVILQVRPRKSAHAYKSIWTERGSPLMVHTQDLAVAVDAELKSRGGKEIRVEIAMRYGQPSLPQQLRMLKDAGVEKFIVLPLYPQYAAATTASIFDKVAETFRRWRHVPELKFFSDYHLHPSYIHAVVASIRQYRETHGSSQLLLFSFHGLPKRCVTLGDPYYGQCVASTKAIVSELGLADGEWQLVFQSRFGKQEWIKPYCVDTLQALPSQGIKTVDVVCPGFAVDCLETVEEIAITNRELFMAAGGEDYRYIPALNASPDNARALADVILSSTR